MCSNSGKAQLMMVKVGQKKMILRIHGKIDLHAQSIGYQFYSRIKLAKRASLRISSHTGS
jgi:hypothetical protein